MSHNSRQTRIERLYTKASGFIDDAVTSGEITSCSYDPRTGVGFTYLEMPTGEEITRYSDGTIHILSANYTDRLRVIDTMLSVSIPGDGSAATVIEHRTDPSENLGQQSAYEIAAKHHEYAAILILGHIASGVMAPEAA